MSFILQTWQYIADLERSGFAAGLLALFAAWFGGEHFIIRQVRTLLQGTTRLAAGDLSARTGGGNEPGELGDLARTIDSMAGTLEQRVREQDNAECDLRTRAQQQTAVAALGQFALVSNDFDVLLDQVVAKVSETLEIELCEISELAEDTGKLVLRAGRGWQNGMVGQAAEFPSLDSLSGLAIQTQEAIRVADYRTERRFSAPTLARYHGALSGVTVAIMGRDRDRPMGVIGVHTIKLRDFTNDDEQFLRAVANLLAMTIERKRAEAEMNKRAAFAQLNPTPAIEVNGTGEITYFNDAAMKLAQDTGHAHPRELLSDSAIKSIAKMLSPGCGSLEFDTHQNERTLSWSVHSVFTEQLVHCYVTDVTERLKLEAHLRQNDKMQSIGQLAAGVAHDFNNMLTVIQGHAGILLKKADRNDGAMDSAQAIYFAAERAAGLTRQLLMFSRKNMKQLGSLNLPEVAQGMSDMLWRLLGETIALEFVPAASPHLVSGDRNEIEQVIMNLVVNARDAMPKGGSVRIETDAVQITADDLVFQPQARSGSFVRLRVVDTGSGMDEATLAHIFEPFFTTKELGKGTGLGLATVYGIVKQHEGWLEVASELQKGTTFSVFLPALAEPVPVDAPLARSPAEPDDLSGTETLLIVEDEPELREMAVQILGSFGYRTLTAGSGSEAERVWAAHAPEINLVLTDMVMPGGMSGWDLAKKLIAERPNLPIVIASGYSVDDISDELNGNKNISFVQKPYTLDTLAKTIRMGLDTHPRTIG